MELVLNDEQRLLKESAEKLVAQLGGPAACRAVRDTDDGFDRARHRAVADAGWLAILVPERLGGLGLGMTELALVLEQAGRGLMTEPVCATAVTAYAIGTGRAATGSTAILDDLVAGNRIILPALRDPSEPEESRERIAAMHYHYGYQLTGRRTAVPQAPSADTFLVDAATSDGSVMVMVPRDLHGVIVSATATVDGIAHGTVDFSEASTMGDEWLIAGARQGDALTADACDRLLLGTSAEMLGVMEQALDLALGYVRTREQFGRPIGSFQAVQHRAVDAHTETELTRSLLFQVCAAFDGGRGSRAMAAAVKARASAAVLEVTKSVIQMHGAIGFTDEYDAGLYLRRAMTLSARYGNAAFHRARYSSLSAVEAEGADTRPRPKRRKRRKSIFATS
jgi:alkylation response protein AidB-like acyl-CoA dehydrogenase